MKYYDNMLLHELYHEQDKLEMQRKELRKYRRPPQGMTLERALQDIEEELVIIRDKIEELSIVQSDFINEEYY